MTDALRLCDVRAMLCSSIVARSEGCRKTHSGFCDGVEQERVGDDMTQRDAMRRDVMKCDALLKRRDATRRVVSATRCG